MQINYCNRESIVACAIIDSKLLLLLATDTK